MFEKTDTEIETRIDSLRSISDQDCFAFGIYCMEGHRFNEAILAFYRLLDSKVKDVRTASKWYLGLCLLRTGEIDEATRIFNEIRSEDGHPFQKQSVELLKKIS